jgi:hypothetical protein
MDPEQQVVSLDRHAVVGIMAARPLGNHVDVDGAINLALGQLCAVPNLQACPAEDVIRNFFEGGRTIEVLAGVKIGRRARNMGVFARVRPGVIVRTDALTAATSGSLPDGTPTFVPTAKGARAFGALDVGGTVERYLGRRLFVRVDIGDVITFFRRPTLPAALENVVLVPPPLHTIQALASFGTRF